MGKLIFALGLEFYRMEVLLGNMLTEMDVNQTSELLLEWEASVGIPDPCFGRFDDTQARRDAVLNKLSNYAGVQTLEDFERILTIFGVTGMVRGALESAVFPMEFPIRFFDTKVVATHTIIVDLARRRETFPFSDRFPIPFTRQINSVIICVLRTLRPANVQILFNFTINGDET